MTENEKLFVEVARELKKMLDNKNTMSGTGEVSLRGYFPEALWNKLHFKAGVFLSNDLEGQAARTEASTIAALEARVAALEQVEKRSADVMQEIAQDALTDYVTDGNHWKDYLRDLVSKCVDDIDLDGFVETYLRDKGYVKHEQFMALLKRVEHMEHEAEIERNVEIALSSIMDEAVIDAENYAVFHRKFQSLLKYHFGKLAREVKP